MLSACGYYKWQLLGAAETPKVGAGPLSPEWPPLLCYRPPPSLCHRTGSVTLGLQDQCVTDVVTVGSDEDGVCSWGLTGLASAALHSLGLILPALKTSPVGTGDNQHLRDGRHLPGHLSHSVTAAHMPCSGRTLYCDYPNGHCS